MTAKYLVRFDDICPGMNWEVWDQVEKLLVSYNIKPILAIVPDNQDPKLNVSAESEDFWARAQSWKDRSWSLAIHGYQHRYETEDSGLIGINAYSEFAGLSYEQQLHKLSKAVEIFKQHNLPTNLWVAPAHSFDKQTLKALRELGFSQISDGFSLFPYTDGDSLFWIPQQLWKFRRLALGVWTVCFHINSWGTKEINKFENDLKTFGSYISDIDSLHDLYSANSSSLVDKSFGHLYKQIIKVKRRIQCAA